MKTVAIIQSNYIPWKGYFDIIHDVDEFIFLDDVQFTKQDWRSRNMIKTSQGIKWITVPAGSDLNRLIQEVEICNSSWQKNHWMQICHSYSKAQYFDQYRDFFEDVYLHKTWKNLSEMNQYLIVCISQDILDIKTVFSRSSDYAAEGKKQAKILDLLKKSAADCYVSGPAAKSYIVEDDFVSAGIKLIWKDYSGYPEYSQLYPPFEHNVSILDLLFNVGKDAPYYIWGWRES